ncbi:prepilin peptidase [Paenibacillus sp. S150]|uniref:A24 family peptidase n=1 Tax=Paenibacillus sp. S150 TaxID=2749826 RepID=UPI001C58C039|nr:prepilin peptidase [Paenibacillus sp. S150]MBW4083437.1 prepilin peptidase [Paenibacillus sp. S150]
MAVWAFWGCLPFLAAALFTDIRFMRIPNWITFPLLIAGLNAQGIMNGRYGVLASISGAGTGFLLLLIMHLLGAVGAGDVKLFTGIGAWAGILFTLQVIVYSVLFGAVIGWVIVLARREAGSRIRGMISRSAGFLLLRDSPALRKSSGGLLKFPFMLAVIPGFICAYLYL